MRKMVRKNLIDDNEEGWGVYNRQMNDLVMVRNAFVGGMYPNVAFRDGDGRFNIKTSKKQTVGTLYTPENTITFFNDFCTEQRTTTPIIGYNQIFNQKASHIVIGSAMILFLTAPGDFLIDSNDAYWAYGKLQDIPFDLPTHSTNELKDMRIIAMRDFENFLASPKIRNENDFQVAGQIAYLIRLQDPCEVDNLEMQCGLRRWRALHVPYHPNLMCTKIC